VRHRRRLLVDQHTFSTFATERLDQLTDQLENRVNDALLVRVIFGSNL
jgi:hypothetical protein